MPPLYAVSAPRIASTVRANSSGCEYPTVSGMFMIRAPAAAAT
jgi:hypothetical protein